LTEVSDSTLNLKLRREMHMKTITCEASNTVASVKASIQLSQLLYKPKFMRGSKTFIQINRNACNKPITLDCQVNSNPQSSVTWYRRRLSAKFMRKIVQNQDKEGNLLLKGKQNNQNKNKVIDLNDFDSGNVNIFDYEPIGLGPTYTIASFNCDNLLSNLKNKTQNMRTATTLPVRNTSMSSSSAKEDYSIDDEEIESTNDEYFVYDDEELIQSKDSNVNTHASSYINTQYNDFGVYMCEAKNSLDSNVFEHRRFIKLNPQGVPIAHPVLSSLQTADENLNYLMKNSINDAVQPVLIDIPVSLGASISLTCIIEPMPKVDSVLWLRDNGKIVPNSKFNRFDSSSFIEGKSQKKIKVKYENLTLISSSSIGNVDFLSEPNHKSGVQTLNGDSVNLLRSILFIKSIGKDGLGTYKCRTQNSYGSTTIVFMVREKSLLDRLKFLSQNSYMSLAFLLASASFILICFFMLIMCMVSPRARRLFCGCCCYSNNKTFKEKKSKEKSFI
jgi:hypothetical protein